MFNFNCISPPEFELLSKDILEKMLGEELRTYATGPDKGIDIRGFIGNDLVIQVKHFSKSTLSDLKTSLKKELDKVQKLKPKRYMIITSCVLTPPKEDEIYDLFKQYMRDKKDIIDLTVIEAFLEKDENIEILKKHNKLWLTSTKVLDIIFNRELDIDSNVFFSDYKLKANLFVFSKMYYETIDILNDNNVIIIDGDPGVGKTTLSKMVASHFISEGYKFRYASSNTISEIKKGITEDEKEIILMDNFLGQRIEDILLNYYLLNFTIKILKWYQGQIIKISRANFMENYHGLYKDWKIRFLISDLTLCFPRKRD